MYGWDGGRGVYTVLNEGEGIAEDLLARQLLPIVLGINIIFLTRKMFEVRTLFRSSIFLRRYWVYRKTEKIKIGTSELLNHFGTEFRFLF